MVDLVQNLHQDVLSCFAPERLDRLRLRLGQIQRGNDKAAEVAPQVARLGVGAARVVRVHVNDGQWPDGLAPVTPDMRVWRVHFLCALESVQSVWLFQLDAPLFITCARRSSSSCFNPSPPSAAQAGSPA